MAAVAVGEQVDDGVEQCVLVEQRKVAGEERVILRYVKQTAQVIYVRDIYQSKET